MYIRLLAVKIHAVINKYEANVCVFQWLGLVL